MKYIILGTILLLTACSTIKQQDIKVIYKDKAVVYVIPEENFIIPEYPRIDINNMKQSNVAVWILQNEKRADELEAKLKTAKMIQDENIKKVEQSNKKAEISK